MRRERSHASSSESLRDRHSRAGPCSRTTSRSGPESAYGNEPLRRSSADHRCIHTCKSVWRPGHPCSHASREGGRAARSCGPEAQCHSARHSSNSRAFADAPGPGSGRASRLGGRDS